MSNAYSNWCENTMWPFWRVFEPWVSEYWICQMAVFCDREAHLQLELTRPCDATLLHICIHVHTNTNLPPQCSQHPLQKHIVCRITWITSWMALCKCISNDLLFLTQCFDHGLKWLLFFFLCSFFFLLFPWFLVSFFAICSTLLPWSFNSNRHLFASSKPTGFVTL